MSDVYFIVRDESPDYGVDFSAELGIEDKASNFRFQIQLKSKDKPDLRGRELERWLARKIKSSPLVGEDSGGG